MDIGQYDYVVNRLCVNYMNCVYLPFTVRSSQTYPLLFLSGFHLRFLIHLQKNSTFPMMTLLTSAFESNHNNFMKAAYLCFSPKGHSDDTKSIISIIQAYAFFTVQWKLIIDIHYTATRSRFTQAQCDVGGCLIMECH